MPHIRHLLHMMHLHVLHPHRGGLWIWVWPSIPTNPIPPILNCPANRSTRDLSNIESRGVSVENIASSLLSWGRRCTKCHKALETDTQKKKKRKVATKIQYIDLPSYTQCLVDGTFSSLAWSSHAKDHMGRLSTNSMLLRLQGNINHLLNSPGLPKVPDFQIHDTNEIWAAPASFWKKITIVNILFRSK